MKRLEASARTRGVGLDPVGPDERRAQPRGQDVAADPAMRAEGPARGHDGRAALRIHCAL